MIIKGMTTANLKERKASPKLAENPSMYACFEHFYTQGAKPIFRTFTTKPDTIDNNTWVLEALRYFLIRFSSFVVELQSVCTETTCPTMGTSINEFVCASHNPPQDCSAMNYSLHLISSSISLINNSNIISSRVEVTDKQLKIIWPCFRRLYRIFLHGICYHKQFVEDWESKTKDKTRFESFCLKYGLISKEDIIK